MRARNHLFVAAETAFGEAVLGLRIARELHARGDRIFVLAGERLSVLTEGTPFTSILVPRGGHGHFDKTVAKTAAEVRADSIVLLDATLVYWLLKEQGTDATFLRGVRAPVIGLDVWNVRETGLTWDVSGTTWEHSKHSLEVKRRLVPVPFARPTGASGLYDALPPPSEIDSDEKEDVRADFGVGKKDRLVLLTSAHWQHSPQPHETGRRLAAALPPLVGELLGRLGARVRVVHVGPEPYPMPSLGDRYTWLTQRAPARFAKILSSSDLLLTFNFSATTISSAIASGLPVLLGISSREGGALAPFRVWPLGLHRYLAPLVVDNPYTTAIRTAEVVDEAAFVESLRTMLFDDGARALLLERQASYRREVAKLPNAADLVLSYLAS